MSNLQLIRAIRFRAIERGTFKDVTPEFFDGLRAPAKRESK
jgi:hypothetical protein